MIVSLNVSSVTSAPNTASGTENRIVSGWMKLSNCAASVRVEPEDSQQSREARQVAVDDPLQVCHAPAVPVLELLSRQNTHRDQHVNRRHDLPVLEKAIHRARDPRVEQILAIGNAPAGTEPLLRRCLLRRHARQCAAKMARGTSSN